MTDTRQALAALMGLAAECAQRKPLRAFEDFTEATHIGHRQFGRAYERADEDVRMLAVRLRAVFDALAPALAAQPVAGAVATDETGWLIEHSGEILPGEERRAQVGWLRVQMKFNGYGAREFGFTHDANEALRFSRREDAEAVLAMHLGARPPDWYSNPFSVTEHMWPAAPQAQAASAPEPSDESECEHATIPGVRYPIIPRKPS